MNNNNNNNNSSNNSNNKICFNHKQPVVKIILNIKKMSNTITLALNKLDSTKKNLMKFMMLTNKIERECLQYIHNNFFFLY